MLEFTLDFYALWQGFLGYYPWKNRSVPRHRRYGNRPDPNHHQSPYAPPQKNNSLIRFCFYLEGVKESPGGGKTRRG